MKAGEKYLITSDNWFEAPDGNQYKSAWGSIEILEDNILGIKTNKLSTNWYVKIGSEEKFCIMAGCQIHYAVRSPRKPVEEGYHWAFEKGEFIEAVGKSRIYIAE